MAVAIRTITRLQDADDAPSLGAGQNGYALTWNNATSAFVATALPAAGVTDHGALTGLADDDHTQYLLATGTRAGATSQAQTFTNGIIGPTWRPASDDTTALQIKNASGLILLNFDTTNRKIGVNSEAPSWMDAALYATRSASSTIYNSYVAHFQYVIYNPGGAITSYASGVDCSFDVNDSGNAVNGEIVGGRFYITNYNSAKVQGMTGGKFFAWYGDGTAGSSDFARGGHFQVIVQDSTVTSVYGTYVDLSVDTGSVSYLYGHYIPSATLGSGTIANNYGLYIEDVNVGTNKYAIFTRAGHVILNGYADANSKVGIGTVSPSAMVHVSLKNSTTSSSDNVLILNHNSTGTPAKGFGTAMAIQGETSTTENVDMAEIVAIWNTATHASRQADLILSAYDTSKREGLRIQGNGSAPAIGFLGATPAARRAHVADPSGGATVDAEARSAINSILATLENFGFHATS